MEKEEEIHPVDFPSKSKEEAIGEEICHDVMLSLLPWHEIKNCPGRFVLRKKGGNYSNLTPSEFIYEITNHRMKTYIVDGFVSKMNEKILLIPFSCQGGLLTYVKGDGSYVHTLNTPSGYKRKLEALGIPLEVTKDGIEIKNLSLWGEL